MSIQTIVFPFDLFGSAGTGAGAQLLADAIHEMLEDVRAETRPCRAQAYRDVVEVQEFAFETLAQCGDWRKSAKQAIRQAFKQQRQVLWLSGNHLGVLPVYEALEATDLVIQFDAHLDIYNLDECTEELSHGNFLLHAAKKLPRVVNVGSRDLFLPATHHSKFFERIWDAEEIACEPLSVHRQLAECIKSARRVWIDIDCDVFDPAYFPAVQNPHPFGISPKQLLQILSLIPSEKRLGLSLSEFDPGRDRVDQSLGTLIWLIEWMFLQWTEAR